MRQVEIKIKNTLPNNNQELSTSEKVSSFADFNLNIESLLSMAWPNYTKKKIGDNYKKRPVVTKISSFLKLHWNSANTT